MNNQHKHETTPSKASSPEHASPTSQDKTKNHDGIKKTDMQQTFTTGQELDEDDALAEGGLTEAETAHLASEVVVNLRNGLEKSEEKAIDVSTAVEQVVILSDRDQYQKAIAAIFNDSTLSTEQKLRLKAEEDARQDTKDENATERVKKLQSSQTMSTVEIIKAYGGIICLGLGSFSVLYLCGTASGRVILNKVATWAIKEVPQLVRQTAI